MFTHETYVASFLDIIIVVIIALNGLSVAPLIDVRRPHSLPLHLVVSVGGGHRLHHVGGRHEAHEAEEKEDDGAQDEARFAEGLGESEGSNSNHQVEDVDKGKLREGGREGRGEGRSRREKRCRLECRTCPTDSHLAA